MHHSEKTFSILCHSTNKKTNNCKSCRNIFYKFCVFQFLTLLFFDATFVSCLLNILVSATMNDRLKTRAVQVRSTSVN